MKKLLVLFMVLGMAASANAALRFTVGGLDPDQLPPIVLMPSDTIEIDIEGDGADENPTPYLIVIGPGSINGGRILYDQGSTLAKYNDAEGLIAPPPPEPGGYWYPMTMEEALAFIATASPDGFGIPGATDFSFVEIISDKSTGIPPTTGTLVDSIIFHCEGPGTVLIRMIYLDESNNAYDYDTLEITQLIPEPITIGLLGLGALFLRRRK